MDSNMKENKYRLSQGFIGQVVKIKNGNIVDMSKENLCNIILELYENRMLMGEDYSQLILKYNNKYKRCDELLKEKEELRRKLNKIEKNYKEYFDEKIDTEVEKVIQDRITEVKKQCNNKVDSLEYTIQKLENQNKELEHKIDVWKAKYTSQADANVKLINMLNKE